MASVKRIALGGSAVATAWFVAFVSVVRRPVVRSDEAWFLWVAVRANSGTPMYRGVYFVTTPLSMWLMQAGVWAFGAHVSVERALASACFAASLALVWVIAARLGVPKAARVVIGAGLFLGGAPATHFTSVYSMLAVTMSLGAMLALSGSIAAREAGSSGAAGCVTTGVLCGAAFAAKPNVGVVAMLAAVASLILSDRWSDRHGGGLRRVVAACGLGFGGAVAVTLLPFVINGTLGNLVGDVVVGKGSSYLSVEAFGYGGATQILLLGAIAFSVAGMCRAPTATRRAMIAPCAFVLVGFVVAAPDFRSQHVTEAFPLLALSGAMLAAAHTANPIVPGRLGRRAVASAAMVAVVGVAVMGWWAHRPPVHGRDTVVAERAAYFSGSLTTQASEQQVGADLTELRRDTGGTVFLAFINAGYYYLAGQLRNPTAYDYPGRSDLGPDGEQGAIRALRRRHVRWVCVRRPTRAQPTSPITPRRLETFVRLSFRFVERLNVCDLYRSPADTVSSEPASLREPANSSGAARGAAASTSAERGARPSRARLASRRVG